MNKLKIVIWILLVFFISACGKSNSTSLPTPTKVITQATAEDEGNEGIDFIKTYGGNQRDRGINLIETSDGGYAVIGYTSSWDAEQEDIYLVRTDSKGDLLWEMTYGGPGIDNGWGLIELDDGGFMIAGFTDSYGAGQFDIYLIRTSPEGNLLWDQTFGGPGDDLAWSIAYQQDGSVAVAGQTESFGEGDKDGYLVIVDANGNEIASSTYGGTGEDRLYSIDLGADGGYILTGTTTSFGAGGRNAFLVKTDPATQQEWVSVFGEDQDDVAHAVRRTEENNYLLTGYTKSFGSANYDSWLMLVDGSGEVIWQTFYGEPNDDRTIYGEQTDDGGFIYVGYTRSFGAIGWDVFVVKTDSMGEVLWHQIIGEKGDDTGYTIIQNEAGSYILTGESYSYGPGGGDLLLVKLGQEGH